MTDKLITIKQFKDLLPKTKLALMEEYGALCNYIDFLEKPLNLDMFVPCLDGVPLEKPSKWDESNEGQEQLKQYQQSEAKVLFKGFEWDSNEQCLMFGSLEFESDEDSKVKDLLDDFPFEYELTESAKQLMK